MIVSDLEKLLSKLPHDAEISFAYNGIHLLPSQLITTVTVSAERGDLSPVHTSAVVRLYNNDC